MKAMRYKIAMVLSLLSLPAMLLVASGGRRRRLRTAPSAAGAVTSSSLGSFKPTFTGSAATGCAGCDLLTGPFRTPSTAHLSASQSGRGARSRWTGRGPCHYCVPGCRHANGPTAQIPTVSCQPLRPGCDTISSFAGGAASVKGINAVDSASLTTNVAVGDIEPPDQGLCAGNGSVVETNNIGEILIFNKALKRTSPVISLDTIMGLDEAALEQRRGPVVPVGPRQRRALVLHPDRLEEPGVQGRPVRGLLRGQGQHLPRGHLGDQGRRARSARTTPTSSTPTTTRRSRVSPSCSTTSRRSRPPGTRSCCSTTSSR